MREEFKSKPNLEPQYTKNSKNLCISSIILVLTTYLMLFVTDWKASHCQKGYSDFTNKYYIMFGSFPSVPVNHSHWVATTEDSTTQNARNDMPMTEGTGMMQKAVSNTPTEKRESAKLADGTTEQKTEENASCTMTSKYAL